MTRHAQKDFAHWDRNWLLDDVTYIADVKPHDPAIPKGSSDWIFFPEFAELSGFVTARDPAIQKKFGATRDMPTDFPGLLELAKDMDAQRERVHDHIAKR